MEVPVRQWFMTVILFLLTLGQSVEAKEKARRAPGSNLRPNRLPRQRMRTTQTSRGGEVGRLGQGSQRPARVVDDQVERRHQGPPGPGDGSERQAEDHRPDCQSPVRFPPDGQLALGRTHWPQLNAAQREKFIRLFVGRLKAFYLGETALYTDEEFELSLRC